jgi:hypothetical protein
VQPSRRCRGIFDKEKQTERRARVEGISFEDASQGFIRALSDREVELLPFNVGSELSDHRAHCLSGFSDMPA